MAKEPTKPLKVTAKLLDGRINSSDGIIMLDGILYHAWFAKYYPEVFETGQWMDHGSGYVGLPLRQYPDNRWAASRAIYTESAQNIEHWNKRPNFIAPDKVGFLAEQKGIVSDKAGVYRAYRTPNIIRTVENRSLEFYCVGHTEKVLDLLGYIVGTGKKNSMGWGIVKEWGVEEISDDYSQWHPNYGLMRPLLVEESENYNITGYPVYDYAVKPPYWKKTNMRRCYVPVALTC